MYAIIKHNIIEELKTSEAKHSSGNNMKNKSNIEYLSYDKYLIKMAVIESKLFSISTRQENNIEY